MKRNQIPQEDPDCGNCPCFHLDYERDSWVCGLYPPEEWTKDFYADGVRLPICVKQRPFIGAWKEEGE